jgi:hypothetical protein
MRAWIINITSQLIVALLNMLHIRIKSCVGISENCWYATYLLELRISLALLRLAIILLKFLLLNLRKLMSTFSIFVEW